VSACNKWRRRSADTNAMFRCLQDLLRRAEPKDAAELLHADVRACARALGRKLPPLGKRYSMQAFTICVGHASKPDCRRWSQSEEISWSPSQETGWPQSEEIVHSTQRDAPIRRFQRIPREILAAASNSLRFCGNRLADASKSKFP
jgi:hypothetical protein